MLTINDMTVVYGKGHYALNQVSLTMEAGNIIGIIGPNGVGKSSFMKATLGLIDYQGQVELAGYEGENLFGRVAYVEQKSQLDHHFPITVRECVSLGRYGQVGLFRRLKKEDWGRVDEVLEQVGLLELKDRSIKTLSGGQFQRMLVARCLIQEADLIFLDEPFVGIDSLSENILMDIFRELACQGKLILVVHHDLHTVRSYFDKVLLLNKELIAYGEVEDVFVASNLKQAYGDRIFLGEEG